MILNTVPSLSFFMHQILTYFSSVTYIINVTVYWLFSPFGSHVGVWSNMPFSLHWMLVVTWSFDADPLTLWPIMQPTAKGIPNVDWAPVCCVILLFCGTLRVHTAKYKVILGSFVDIGALSESLLNWLNTTETATCLMQGIQTIRLSQFYLLLKHSVNIGKVSRIKQLQHSYKNNHLLVMLTPWFACRRWVK